ncbi:MAG: 16S rRNA (uracil(1498)-N(3))-methyltransferase [Clostridia bacterium]|nr:16S rRNA (uracil(1498)-N(3))-methyltransferase [Clostridia bacterium]
MPKFFLSDSKFRKSDVIEIKGDDAHHISKTLRMKVGDALTVTSSDGMDYLCLIDAFTPDAVMLTVQEVIPSHVESDIKISVFQALVKGDKMETVIQKSVELGASEIYPVSAERSVMKLDSAGERKKLERWNKIALEAAKQCGRGFVPTVHNVISFEECVRKMSERDVSFFCYELAEGKTVKDVIGGKSFSSVGFYIGPEGGVAPKEAELARSHGIEAVSLGKLILRTETAGPAVLSMLLYETRL